MKHQYFGDVNDYRKYGLLRGLHRHSGLRVGVCWMLTPDDGRTDGKFISYLKQPALWRRFDESLFDTLRVSVEAERHLSHVQRHDIVPGAVYVDDITPDSREGRAAFFQTASERLRDTELVFFDPDNGLEIKSCPVGRKNSSKYLMMNEVAATYGQGKSLLIYQHFKREQRDAFVARTADALGVATGSTSVHCFRTANVAFFLVSQPHHATQLSQGAELTRQAWTSQISVRSFQPISPSL